MTPDEHAAALVTYSLTGIFTPRMVVMRGVPFAIEKVTIVRDTGDGLVDVTRPDMAGIWEFRRTQLRPIAKL